MVLMRDIAFPVIGTPIAQGSKIGGVTKAGKPYMRESNPNLKLWREQVAQAAWRATNGEQFSGPIEVRVRFYFERPKSQMRPNGDPRPDAPAHCTRRIDVDKLQRAIGDALTDSIIEDDSLIIQWNAGKEWADTRSAGAFIEVRSLT